MKLDRFTCCIELAKSYNELDFRELTRFSETEQSLFTCSLNALFACGKHEDITELYSTSSHWIELYNHLYSPLSMYIIDR